LGVGRLVSHKCFRNLIDAFAIAKRSRDIRLVILGEGRESKALKDQVCRLGLQDSVQMPGFLANPYACTKRAAVLAFTSSEFEGLPTVLIDLASRRVQIIGSTLHPDALFKR
jgi:glycosyltransferase involved in cell wall biosynthesis